MIVEETFDRNSRNERLDMMVQSLGKKVQAVQERRRQDVRFKVANMIKRIENDSYSPTCWK